jgi:CHAT domain-containing protein
MKSTNIYQHQKGTDAVSRPRLWWCPVGVFAELPLHAAGVYKGTHQHCLSDYVVSSYTPTLSALVNARMEQDGPGSDRILLVSLPDVKDLSPIPKAAEEADVIKRTVPSGSLTCLSGDQASVQTTTLSNDQASIQNVMEKLPGAAVLHLACHGHQSQDDPLSSGFSLHDGRLRLEQLMSLQMPKAQLAYLSACETASVDKNQPDEAINLASTMLFVGFRSVIATMWYGSRWLAKRPV